MNEKIYLKDPDTSDLGRNILTTSIHLIDEKGFESFTFKKLAEEIRSTEASVYRYFESKHKLLFYLTSWYWGWLEYKLVFSLANLDKAEDRLRRAIRILTEKELEEHQHPFLDLQKLNRIIVSESAKTYLSASVDRDNNEGYYEGYKQLVRRVSDLVLSVKPGYPYPHMLISTVIEGAHHQHFFSEHLPSLTDSKEEEETIPVFYNELVCKALDIETS